MSPRISLPVPTAANRGSEAHVVMPVTRSTGDPAARQSTSAIKAGPLTDATALSVGVTGHDD